MIAGASQAVWGLSAAFCSALPKTSTQCSSVNDSEQCLHFQRRQYWLWNIQPVVLQWLRLILPGLLASVLTDYVTQSWGGGLHFLLDPYWLLLLLLLLVMVSFAMQQNTSTFMLTYNQYTRYLLPNTSFSLNDRKSLDIPSCLLVNQIISTLLT